MLTEIQLFVIATAASAIVWTLKLTKVQLSSGWLTALVYGVSGALAFLFAPVALPSLPTWGGDLSVFVPALLVWLGDLLVPLSAFVGFATLVYNVLLKAVLEKYVRPVASRFKR